MIKGHNLKAPMGYFISNQHINKGLDPNIHVIDGIYNIKGRSHLHILVANYTNKHVTFNKGQCIGHIEPSIDYMLQTSIKDDTLTPPLHTHLSDVRKSLNQMETFKLQFAQDETSIGTSHKNEIDTGNSEPVLQRSYPIAMKYYDWVRSEINKLLDAQVIHSNHSSCWHLSL